MKYVKQTTEGKKNKFIEKSKLIHDDKYLYDDIEYINASTKVKIFCKKCNEYFYQTPNSHISKNIIGCPNCGGTKKSCTEDFVNKSIILHGDKYLYDLVVYINNKTKVKIFCKKCNEYFLQRPNDHLLNHGCKKMFKQRVINK